MFAVIGADAAGYGIRWAAVAPLIVDETLYGIPFQQLLIKTVPGVAVVDHVGSVERLKICLVGYFSRARLGDRSGSVSNLHPCGDPNLPTRGA